MSKRLKKRFPIWSPKRSRHIKMHSYLKLFAWIIIYLAVGFGIGQITQGSIDSWYKDIQKPSFNPPNWIFPLMWSLLYVTIAAAGWNLWERNGTKTLKILFALYTVLNWAWTPIFFGAQQIGLALFWIIAINVVNFVFIKRAWKAQHISAYLMIPVFLWTLFAMVLNYNIWMLNS